MMRRILMLLTVVAMMVAMMVVMAGTASAQATFVPTPCGFPPNVEREELGTFLLVPGEGPGGTHLVCTGKPFNFNP
jgi:hypothetical protein